jgi:Mg-chelatase subunit ChlD
MNHYYVLLDRSGSMESMRTEVISGFNHLLAEQQANGKDARMTLVQFDSEDAHEVLADAVAIDKVRRLSTRTFVPRSCTPLLDATGRIITRATERESERRRRGKRPEAITVVTITDGMENQSTEFGRKEIMRLVKEREARGWTFVFLGAGLDAYGEAGSMGYDPRSVQAWAPDGAGAGAAFHSLSAAMVSQRDAVRAAAPIDNLDFFKGDKPAEADRDRRHR